MNSTHCVFVESIDRMAEPFETFHNMVFIFAQLAASMLNWVPGGTEPGAIADVFHGHGLHDLADLAFWQDPLLLRAQSKPKKPHARDGHEVQDRSLQII